MSVRAKTDRKYSSLYTKEALYARDTALAAAATHKPNPEFTIADLRAAVALRREQKRNRVV